MAYPGTPGWKAEGPSRDAAKAVTRHAKTLRDRVHRFLQEQYPSAYSADQIAARLGETILSVRPRVSELHKAQLIEAVASRSKNQSGMTANCWRAVASASEGATV
jgi:predicted ArsR family transcriptional regulator